MIIAGREYTKAEVLQYMDLNPVLEYDKEVLLFNGGLMVRIMKDRGLDIANAFFGGGPVTFNAKTQNGVSGAFAQDFFGGLLTTCGPLNAGTSCEDGGRLYEMHGTHNKTRAYDVCVRSDWMDDELVTKISGKIKTASLFGENLVLHREITSVYGKEELNVKDVLENRSFEETPFMMLYHMNFGFPFLDENTVFCTNAGIAEDINGYSDVTKRTVFCKPTLGYREEVFAYRLKGAGFAQLANNGIFLRIDFENFPYLIQWKQMGQGDYALGLEPSTNKPLGRVQARKDGELLTLKPLETKTFQIKIKAGRLC